MAALVLLQGGEATRFDLKGGETTIGRHPDCGLQLQSNMVSRMHARVLTEGAEFSIEDMGSGNGTFVNGKKIEARTPLKHDDRIKLGPVLLRFEVDEGARGPARRSIPGGPTHAFQLNIASGAEDSVTVMGALEGSSAFGMLDVQPGAKLKAVLEISRSLAGAVELEAILPKMLDTLFSIFPHADRGCVLLKDDNGQMIPAAQKHRRATEDSSVKLSRTILNKVLDEKQGVLSADASSDAQFQASESISSLTIRSMMCVPMLGLGGDPIGVINIDTQNPLNQFKKDDLDLLLAVAGQAALSYESARLLVSHIEKVKQDNEMRIARNVQRALLPGNLPSIPGYEFFASYESALAVGGDYYDSFLLDDGKICLSFGDVAGKGVPASLVMSRISSVVRSTLQYVHDVAEAVGAINNHMCANAVEGRFVTYTLVVLDTKTHEMTAVICGHMPPIIRHADRSVEEWGNEAIGLPIGVIEDYPYDIVRRTIAPGETVVIYTCLARPPTSRPRAASPWRPPS